MPGTGCLQVQDQDKYITDCQEEKDDAGNYERGAVWMRNPIYYEEAVLLNCTVVV